MGGGGVEDSESGYRPEDWQTSVPFKLAIKLSAIHKDGTLMADKSRHSRNSRGFVFFHQPISCVRVSLRCLLAGF